MEFNEKLQKLRKDRKLTQEELAEALYVSRTAISKWESGRGYPSIDSLKEISGYFSVSIDDLLSGERIISIAEKENKSNINNFCDLLFGGADILYASLLLLPVYSKHAEDRVLAVNLFGWDKGIFGALYAALLIGIIAFGAIKIFLNRLKIERGRKVLTGISVILGIATALILAMIREAYAVSAAFLLLILKGMLILKYEKAA